MKLYQYHTDEDNDLDYWFYLSKLSFDRYYVTFNNNREINYDGYYCWCERYSHDFKFITKV